MDIFVETCWESELSNTRRTVISPYNLNITEIAIPTLMDKLFTSPEIATSHNIKKLKQWIRNGINKYPGATTMRLTDGRELAVISSTRMCLADELQFGHTVYCHLEDVCNPYNANHNGDEMNIYAMMPIIVKAKELQNIRDQGEHQYIRTSNLHCGLETKKRSQPLAEQTHKGDNKPKTGKITHRWDKFTEENNNRKTLL
ncbi:hypothetical protein POM88_043285 [Heracleum sosnowskyi]|uniref:RNA polymerase alpha subunit domain-containing protein n=1 Tax=Heracleum sosnowskyi TaxID=360622 RepID=A0AAD8H3G6_9APIA|nr:hypothetical protein POM88_043285 [Heracleum sosnowskyi]